MYFSIVLLVLFKFRRAPDISLQEIFLTYNIDCKHWHFMQWRVFLLVDVHINSHGQQAKGKKLFGTENISATTSSGYFPLVALDCERLRQRTSQKSCYHISIITACRNSLIGLMHII